MTNRAFRFVEARAVAKTKADQAAAAHEAMTPDQHYDEGARFTVVDRDRVRIQLPGVAAGHCCDASSLLQFMKHNFAESPDG